MVVLAAEAADLWGPKHEMALRRPDDWQSVQFLVSCAADRSLAA
jgi:hypothetical protein